jgi:pilus assembly protein TadC
MVGGPLGVAAGVGGGAAVARWLAGHEPAARRATRIRLARDLPLAADLMATLLHAGATPERATEATAAVIGGPLGDRLAEVAAHLRLGADPTSAWRVVADVSALAPLARALARASTTGAALATTLARLAEEERAAAAWRAELSARRVGVRTAGPLGLCFLPAFILIGVVPVIVGIVQSLDISLG